MHSPCTSTHAPRPQKGGTQEPGSGCGGFVGAWLGEAGSIRAEDPAATFKAASGAALGRLAGTLGKLMVAVVVWVLLVVAAFVP